jgi:sulfite exporter TauE/SafE
MISSLLFSSLILGLTSGPHCMTMCSVSCASFTCLGGKEKILNLILFNLGRVLGYSLMGALAAGLFQAVGWLSINNIIVRKLWIFFHIFLIISGLYIIIFTKNPISIKFIVIKFFKKIGIMNQSRKCLSKSNIFFIGLLWTLMPCGLLYSALMLATLSGDIYYGALMMSIFALCSGFILYLGPFLWIQIKENYSNKFFNESYNFRLSGMIIVCLAGFDLWRGLISDEAPWCIFGLT